jgi:hypothetical protein
LEHEQEVARVLLAVDAAEPVHEEAAARYEELRKEVLHQERRNVEKRLTGSLWELGNVNLGAYTLEKVPRWSVGRGVCRQHRIIQTVTQR